MITRSGWQSSSGIGLSKKSSLCYYSFDVVLVLSYIILFEKRLI